jgi:hypothetical protein
MPQDRGPWRALESFLNSVFANPAAPLRLVPSASTSTATVILIFAGRTESRWEFRFFKIARAFWMVLRLDSFVAPFRQFSSSSFFRKEGSIVSIEPDSPLWAVLADWIKIILTLPDPPPDPLVQLNDVAILTAISALTDRLSPAAGDELRKVLPAITARLKVVA